MNTSVKRFRVFNIEDQKLIGKYDTVKECVNKLKPLFDRFNAPASQGGNPYLDFMIDDVKDDIEVNWIDLMSAWEGGERPKDLQMF